MTLYKSKSAMFALLNIIKSAKSKQITNREYISSSNHKIPTLNKYDFFLHLCSHLYKEATTLPWIEMHRDMTLYKYADIYLLLSEISENDILAIFNRATVLGLDKICAYTILETVELFDIDNALAINMAKETLKEDRTKTQVEGFTKLDLMELTRKHICSHKD